MTLMEFSMIPLDKGSSFSKYVAQNLDIIDTCGLDYRLGPMGTCVEGEWEDLLALLTKCFRSLKDVSDRVSVSVKFDHRKGRSGRLSGKIESVESKVGRELKKS
ncbi:MAG: MTH1187 family thiamine-binding protein [Deltaproteobacteria bacterium]|nr:MTH1187 family thiamine-binding protein [Deltaproteobacteria bacterium]